MRNFDACCCCGRLVVKDRHFYKCSSKETSYEYVDDMWFSKSVFIGQKTPDDCDNMFEQVVTTQYGYKVERENV